MIEEVLWNIFTYYSLHGNPKDPSRLHSLALLKLCKDIHAMDSSMVENALSQQDFQLIYTAILKDPTKKVRTLNVIALFAPLLHAICIVELET